MQYVASTPTTIQQMLTALCTEECGGPGQRATHLIPMVEARAKTRGVLFYFAATEKAIKKKNQEIKNQREKRRVEEPP